MASLQWLRGFDVADDAAILVPAIEVAALAPGFLALAERYIALVCFMWNHRTPGDIGVVSLT
jgi:hypothetical protein